MSVLRFLRSMSVLRFLRSMSLTGQLFMQLICQHGIQFGTKLNVNTDTSENLLKLVPILKSLSQSKA